MTVNGLPLHPLIVHLAVVAVPLAGLGAILLGLVPRWRRSLRWPVTVNAVVAAGATQLAAMSGDSLKDARRITGVAMELHETWAGRLQAGTWVLAAVVVIAAWALPQPVGDEAAPVFRRPAVVGTTLVTRTLVVLLPLVGLLELYLVYRTGDAGARLVWG